TDIDIPCEATVRKVMVQIGLIHKPRRNPNGITKADRLARKSDDLLRRDFYRLYVSVIFDCFDLMPLGIAIEDNMRASLCCHTLENANKSYPDIKGCIIHSDRGGQYTSEEYQAAVKKYGIIQSMNSAGGR
ncbi:DDE-type integrase/transposase/recombinase, partial [Ruminococcus bicirculans]|nr:DDE-type integrase/transposase/recombinase [Ruminococcus bicirculans (ex Wegman et al. 2014)]